jgi:hypothetical protein
MIGTHSYLLTATLSLIMSAVTHNVDGQTATTQVVKATSIPISYLPFNITAPGDYYLVTDLVVTNTNDNYISGILIYQPLSGTLF